MRTSFVTSEGSPYARFKRALRTGNLGVVLRAAAELPTMALDDALDVCLVAKQDPDLYDRAVVRWLGRFCLEVRGVTLDDVQLAATCFEDLHMFPNQALDRLRELCAERGVLRRA